MDGLRQACSHLKKQFLLLPGRRRPRLGQASHACPRCRLARCPSDPIWVAVAATEFRSGCRVRPLSCGRCRIQLAVALLDPSGTEMALHCDADMVWAIVGTCQVKFLSGPASSQGQDALA